MEIESCYQGVDAKVYPTYECKGGCPFCWTEIRPKTSEVSTEEFLANFQQEIESYYDNGGRKVLFTGGEPTEAPNKLLGMLDILQSYQFDLVVLYTNGTNLLKEINYQGKTAVLLNLLKEKGLQSINMSVHHYEQTKRQELSPVVGLVDVEKMSQAISEADISLRLNCTLMKDYIGSLKEVREYVRWTAELGLKDIYFRDLFHVAERSKRTTPGDQKKLEYTDQERIDFGRLMTEVSNDTEFQSKDKLSRHRDWGETYIFTYLPTGAQVSFGTLQIGSERSDEATYFAINPNGKMTPNMNASEYTLSDDYEAT